MKTEELIIYRRLHADDLVRECVSVIDAQLPTEMDKDALPEASREAIAKIRLALDGVVHRLLMRAVVCGWRGNLWQAHLTDLLVNDENAFALACERREVRADTLRNAAALDLDGIAEWFSYDWEKAAAWLDVKSLKYALRYETETPRSQVYNGAVAQRIETLKEALARATAKKDAGTGLRMRTLLEQFYRETGVGTIGLHKAFRAEDGETLPVIRPIRNILHVTLDDLVGYENAKRRLTENTEAFLAGRPANNCLLYGDAGTGKSSSIKAITNAYYGQGLRVIELYKHQTKMLPGIIDQIKNRNYRFIVYMDDLSFEEFETDYKYLKAVIEGGLEKKPENVLIYATSNRRHLIRESFSDKGKILDEDLHKNDTVQEKLSLAHRFGVTIYFGAPGKADYEEIVRTLAARACIPLSDAELLREATRWEMTHGGKSGRTAAQLIDYLAGGYGADE
ncbi:MAG: ATP-binding protein [Lachnospiraceae bacterium]|nr:ATP-binding protein [Lachnospiraceae bacterium]